MDFFTLYKASRKCRCRKRATPQAQFYEAYLLDNLVETVQALRPGSWRPRRPVCFTVDKPKAREIHAAHNSDRVVHHWLVPRLEELYEPVVIHDVYSNRVGKGTHIAVKRLQSFMRGVVCTQREQEPGLAQERVSANGKCCCKGYFLQLKIKNFFNSIDRALLYTLLQERLRKAVQQGKVDESAAVSYRDISHVILKQDVGKESYMATTRKEIARVPAYKRLANSGKDKGLPIGNLTSHFFANVYLNELDQFPLWQPHFVSSYKSQQRFSRRIFPHARIGIQCGCTLDWLNPLQLSHPALVDNPRFFVSKVAVCQQGCLKGGLRRRSVESLTFPPFSQTGVMLCGSVFV